MKVPRFIITAMLKEVEDAINRQSAVIGAEETSYHGWPALRLTCHDEASIEIIAHVRDE